MQLQKAQFNSFQGKNLRSCHLKLKMSNSSSSNAAEGYKQSSLSVQKVVGEKFIQTDVCPQAGDAILDLGCGTGELSAYLAELVGPEGNVVAVDPDKERLLLAQQSYGDVKNLSFVEGSASNFPGIRSQSYDIVFSNQVIHWIPDKQEVFKNMFESLKSGGKIAARYIEHLPSFVVSAYKDLNPENTERLCEMFHGELRATIEQYCSSAGFRIIKSYDLLSTQLVFQNINSLLKWIWTLTHGVFDPKLATDERLQRYYPYASRNGKPPFDFRGIKEESVTCHLIAVKQAGD